MKTRDVNSPLAVAMTKQLVQRARDWVANASAYEIARMNAVQKIGIYASVDRQRLAPWNPNLPVTVVDGKPRMTQETYEAGQAYARRALSGLVEALKNPDGCPDFMREHSSLAVAIFALKQEDREALAQEYEQALASAG